MPKIIVTGLAGCGKSTLARFLSSTFDAKHIDLDKIIYGSARGRWVKCDEEEFNTRLEDAIGEEESWVIESIFHDVSNESREKAHKRLWRHADVIIWLDEPFPVIMGRLFKRCVFRWFGWELSGACKETLTNKYRLLKKNWYNYEVCHNKLQEQWDSYSECRKKKLFRIQSFQIDAMVNVLLKMF